MPGIDERVIILQIRQHKYFSPIKKSNYIHVFKTGVNLTLIINQFIAVQYV
jgi:hypothetical protein